MWAASKNCTNGSSGSTVKLMWRLPIAIFKSASFTLAKQCAAESNANSLMSVAPQANTNSSPFRMNSVACHGKVMSVWKPLTMSGTGAFKCPHFGSHLRISVDHLPFCWQTASLLCLWNSLDGRWKRPQEYFATVPGLTLLSQDIERLSSSHETFKRADLIDGQLAKPQSGPKHARLLHNTSDSSSPLMQSLKLSHTEAVSMHRPWLQRNALFGHDCGRHKCTASSSPPAQSRTWLHTNDASMQWEDEQRNSWGLRRN